MSGFRAAVRAIGGPLDLARDRPEALPRVRNARAALERAVARAAALDIPREARTRLERAAVLLRRGESEDAAAQGAAGSVSAEEAAALTRTLGPLLDPDYPQRVLARPPERVPGIGPRAGEALARKEIRCIEELLFFLPRAYEDRRELTAIEELRVGHGACFEGRVTRAGVVPMRGGRRVFQAVVADGTGAVQLKWFRGGARFAERLRPGARVLVAGDVRRYRYALELHHPDVELLSDDVPVASLPRIVAVYSAVEGLPPRTLRRHVEHAVRESADLVDAHLPPTLAAELGLPEVGDALREVHLPSTRLDPEELRDRRTPYHLRLVAEELFVLSTGLALRRRELARHTAKPLEARGRAVERALASLPFELTADQKRAWSELAGDLGRPRPMNRLLVGDVGTGKTVLAFLAGAAAHASGGLSVVLAPTEILAWQHAETFRELARPLGLRVALLTGSTPAPERRSLARLLRQGEIAMVVGTHALLHEAVELPRLRLVVIDEQHRFGVAERQALSAKGEHPHVLAMSATPIPRTLALTVYGDLDHSVLRERPPGRSPVRTRVVPPTAGSEVLAEIRRTLARGEQVYVVYPLVEESERQDLQDATRGFERLQRALPETPAALLHGRLDADERSRVMRAFVAGDVRLLVSTTVIEVGVDVHRATLLVVQHAERFGLAQLHQLRGRIGRGSAPGTALFFGDPPSEDASRRLAILERTDSGFEIAEEDLRIRGAGEWLGKRQAGHLPELRLADLVRHADLLPPVRAAADDLVASDPDLSRHGALRSAIDHRWGRRLELGAVA